MCAAAERGAPIQRRIGTRPPRVALVAALVVPGREVGVVVLAAGLEQVRVVGDQLVATPAARSWSVIGVLPELDRAPRPPQEVERAAQDVVAGRHARQRAGVVAGRSAPTALREPVEVRRVELAAAVGAEHVPVEAVEQDDDGVLRLGDGPWRVFG